MVNWKSARKNLTPDSPNNFEFSLKKVAKQVHYVNEFDPAKIANELRITRAQEMKTDTFIRALETNLPRIVASDPELGHNCRLLLSLLYITRVLGQRPQQMLVPKSYKNNPTSVEEREEFFRGKVRANRRQSYASYWNCRDVRTRRFNDKKPNKSGQYAAGHIVRCKADKNSKSFKFWIVRGLFDSERGKPFKSDIFQLFRACHSSMKTWASSYPKMKEMINKQVWAWFKKSGRNGYTVQILEAGDQKALISRALTWFKRNTKCKFSKVVLYNARRNLACRKLIQSKAAGIAKLLGHKSRGAINNYTKNLGLKEILSLHREFVNTLDEDNHETPYHTSRENLFYRQVISGISEWNCPRSTYQHTP